MLFHQILVEEAPQQEPGSLCGSDGTGASLHGWGCAAMLSTGLLPAQPWVDVARRWE